MIANWRAVVLLILFLGPIAAYIGVGALWLFERGWGLYAFAIWVTAGTASAYLANRWTKSKRSLLPPIDWDDPHTFAPFDRQAWDLVEAEATQSDSVPIDDLAKPEIYIDTGRRLARRLAAHYAPLSHDPIENVPVVELMTALELAAEDLTRLCRQVPGGDLVTPAHWKRAIQAAEYLNWANEVYTWVLPIFQPMTGLVRLGTQKWMVQPAWKNMQQNLLRWFFQAYVNRLGAHLIELYSGRLSIGADHYRRLTRRARAGAAGGTDGQTLTIVVAGARGSGKSRLVEALDQVRAGDLKPVRERLKAAGFDEILADRLRSARCVEAPGYTSTPGGENARDRSTRRGAVESAVEADLLLMVIDASRDDITADAQFAQAWDRWYVEHPNLEAPPALVVVTGADRPALPGTWRPPHDWGRGQGARESAVRTRVEAIQAALPPTLAEVVAIGLGSEAPFGLAELVLPALAALLHRAERASLIRHLHSASARSKAGRLASQVGDRGKRIWKDLRSRGRSGANAP